MCISIVTTPTQMSSLVWNENDIEPQPPPPTTTNNTTTTIIQCWDLIWKLKIIKDNIKDNFKDEFKQNYKGGRGSWHKNKRLDFQYNASCNHNFCWNQLFRSRFHCWSLFWPHLKMPPILSQPQREHNAAQPQHCSWVGYENDCANPIPPTTITETQQKPSGATD